MKKFFVSLITLLTLGVIVFVGLGKDKSSKTNTTDKFKSKAKKKLQPSKQHTKVDIDLRRFNLASRQKELVYFLKYGRSYTMSKIENKFPEVHVRTLRRDLDKLQKSGLIEKTGSTKAASYKRI